MKSTLTNDLRVSLFSKEDLTDKTIDDFLRNNLNFPIKDYQNLLRRTSLYNELAEKAIIFLCSFDDGFIKPNKYNAYEPVNKPFDPSKIHNAVNWLSQPGGAFFFRKASGCKLEGAIENRRFTPIWTNGELLKPKAQEPVCKMETILLLQEKTLEMKGADYWVNFFCEFSKIISTELGAITSIEEDFTYYPDSLLDNNIFELGIYEIMSL